DTALEQYLIEKKQTKKLMQMLWEPLCLAALNTPMTIASTQIFLNVLKDSFSGSKQNSDFLLPKLDLSRIIATPLAQYIQSKGGEIKLNRRVRNLQTEGDGFSLETKDGKAFFSHVIIAVPPARLDTLAEALPKMQIALKQTQTYGYQPIYTVYLQYPPETKLPSVISGLAGSLGQWIFDRGQLCGQKGLIAVVVSATGAHQLLSHDELALTIAKELSQIYAQLAKPLWHKVIAEKRATFSCTPNLARPTNKTTQPNLFLAGDYTYADYPATIEGAARSGIACADLVCNS
ncbi:MAG: hydroxysqualene dehydroxylase HpnE, partial [Methylococcales bacterium]